MFGTDGCEESLSARRGDELGPVIESPLQLKKIRQQEKSGISSYTFYESELHFLPWSQVSKTTKMIQRAYLQREHGPWW